MHNFIPFFATHRHFLLVFTQFCLACAHRYTRWMFIYKYRPGATDQFHSVHVEHACIGPCLGAPTSGTGACLPLTHFFSLLLCGSRQDVRLLSARFQEMKGWRGCGGS